MQFTVSYVNGGEVAIAASAISASLVTTWDHQDMEQGQVKQRAQQVVLELMNQEAKENYLWTFDDFATSDTYIYRILSKIPSHSFHSPTPSLGPS
nr:hypothetical protein [Tanacetum cinerariifolium]